MTYHTCADVPNVYVKDIIFLVILDTCRNRPNGSQIATRLPTVIQTLSITRLDLLYQSYVQPHHAARKLGKTLRCLKI